MTLTLCIDTATSAGAVVLAEDDQVRSAVRWRAEGKHGEDLLGHIESALGEADVTRDRIELVGVDIGPGRFTSVRVGLATGKGLALGLGVPLVGVHSLRVLARAMGDQAAVCIPILDAYRGDVFAAAYAFSDGRIEQRLEPMFGDPSTVLGALRKVVGGEPVAVCGAGVRSHEPLIRDALPTVLVGADGFDYPSPGALAREVHMRFLDHGPDDLESLEPLYLRPSDAQLPKKPLQVER